MQIGIKHRCATNSQITHAASIQLDRNNSPLSSSCLPLPSLSLSLSLWQVLKFFFGITDYRFATHNLFWRRVLFVLHLQHMNVLGERWTEGRRGGGGAGKLARVDCHLKILRVIDARKAAGDAGIEFTARDAELLLATIPPPPSGCLSGATLMSILMPDLWQRVRLASPWLHLNSIGDEEEEEGERRSCDFRFVRYIRYI